MTCNRIKYRAYEEPRRAPKSTYQTKYSARLKVPITRSTPREGAAQVRPVVFVLQSIYKTRSDHSFYSTLEGFLRELWVPLSRRKGDYKRGKPPKRFLPF